MQNKVFLNADVSDNQAKEQLAQCVRDCLDCQSICLKTALYCLGMSDKYPIRQLLDCIEICQVNADFMLRGSKLRSNLSEICAMCCERCEEFCSQFDADIQMRTCADICRRTAESCLHASHLQTNTFLN